MSTSIDQHFIEQFEADVHILYQRMGSTLQNTVRRKGPIVGTQTTFKRTGKGTAGLKSRHGNVPIMNLPHSKVPCPVTDRYAGEYVDNLDELKTNADERMVAAMMGAAACGRAADQDIVDVLDANATNQTSSTGGVTLPKVEEIFEFFGNNDVPDDGQRYMMVSHQGWTDLLNIDQFANLDYVGADQLPWPSGRTAKSWLGFLVFTFSGLTKAGAIRSSHAWHRTAVGHAFGQQIQGTWSWIGEKHAWLNTHSMSMGACMIDVTGAYELLHTES